MKIKFFTVGGTIDKIYFDRKNTYEVGESLLNEILREANVGFEYEIESVLKKDSLDFTDEDRLIIHGKISSEPERLIVITHGTDTMVETARVLEDIRDKVIVLTGSMQPARFRTSDAVFNVGSAIAAVQSKPPGIYIAMSGTIFESHRVRKNVDKGCFEEI
ncbi:MAG: asparaginase [Deltaproteobacteria bacterium]|nr:asparaginase [Deltaproteobacteria bacterium]